MLQLMTTSKPTCFSHTAAEATSTSDTHSSLLTHHEICRSDEGGSRSQHNVRVSPQKLGWQLRMAAQQMRASQVAGQ